MPSVGRHMPDEVAVAGTVAAKCIAVVGTVQVQHSSDAVHQPQRSET